MQKLFLLAALTASILGNGVRSPTLGKKIANTNQILVGVKKAADGTDAFQAHCFAYGFNIESCWAPVYMSDFKTYSRSYVDEKNVLNYNVEIQEVFLKHTASSDTFAFAYRVVISPKQVRDWGFMGIGSHGDDWIVNGVKTTVNLREYHHLANWAPENQPATTTESIGVGLGKDGPSISASVSFNHSELNIYSGSSTADQKYETDYRVANEMTDYTKNAIKFYGFYTFTVEDNRAAWVDVKHECRLNGKAWSGIKTESFSHTY